MSNFINAIGAGITAAREVYANPTTSKLAASNDARRSMYEKNWQYYTNQAFEDLTVWKSYIKEAGLYQYTRLVYNPFRRLVDFYAGGVYPGRLSLDGKAFPNNVRLAIPFADDVDEKMRAAIAQLWQWSNWHNGMKLMTRYGAVCGDCLVEVVDDTEAGKVRFDVIWAGLLVPDYLVLDAVGNVKRYAYEYWTEDEDGKEYKFRKEVDADEIRYFKDDKPFDLYDEGSAIPNPYGFAPAVWVKHTDLGGDFGAGVFRGDYVKLDELNSAATHALDLIHKLIDPPIVLWSKSRITPAFKTKSNAVTDPVDPSRSYIPNNGSGEEFAGGSGRTSKTVFDVRTDSMILKGAEGGKTEPLVGKLNLSEALPYMASLIEEIEKDHPELTFYQKLREMQQVTGPGARALFGDADKIFDEAAANYDSASARVFAMGVAIGGFRRAEGAEGWAQNTVQQAKFDGFGLESYQRDELHIDIMPRSLIVETESDALSIQQQRFANANQAAGLLPLEERLKIAGFEDDAERARIMTALAVEEAVVEENDEENNAL